MWIKGEIETQRAGEIEIKIDREARRERLGQREIDKERERERDDR
jgi:hypothetical protein